jgi:hypothetical protein
MTAARVDLDLELEAPLIYLLRDAPSGTLERMLTRYVQSSMTYRFRTWLRTDLSCSRSPTK